MLYRDNYGRGAETPPPPTFLGLRKLTYVGKIMAKSKAHNMCRRALLNGNVCKGKGLLTDCESWSRELQIPNVKKRLPGYKLHKKGSMGKK